MNSQEKKTGRFFLVIMLGTTALLTSFAEAQQRPVFVLRGTLTDSTSKGTGRAFKEVELADLNADGRLDLYLPEKQGTGVQSGENRDILYLSTGEFILAVDSVNARFNLIPTASAFTDPPGLDPLMTSRAYDAEIVDLDQDGALDIIRPDRFGRLDVWWGARDPVTGTPTGVFDDRTDVLLQTGFNPNAGCVEFFGTNCSQTANVLVEGNYDDVDVADVDGDGDLDFAVVQRACGCGPNHSGPVHFLVENLREVNPLDRRRFAIRAANGELPAQGTHAVSFGDVDPSVAGSGLDLAFADLDAVHLYFGDGDFGFDPDPLALAESFMDHEIVVADFVHLNVDDKLDLFVAENDVNGTTHGVYFHDPDDDVNPFPLFTAAPQIDFALLGITAAYQGIYDARYANLDLDSQDQMEIVVVNQNVDNSGNVFTTVVQVLRVEPPNQIVEVTSTFMEPASSLEGGMGIDLGDLDNDGDQDMVLAGAVLRAVISPPVPEIFAAATVYENRTVTHLRQRTLQSDTIVGIRELTAGDGVTVPAGENVTFEGGAKIVLSDGFVAEAGSEFHACLFTLCT